MKERGRSTLPTPLGELLENQRDAAREDELWARISARRAPDVTHALPEHASARAELPLPLGRALTRAGDNPSTRLKHWRAISARRGTLKRPQGRSRLFMSAALGSGLSAVAALLLFMFWPGAVAPMREAGPRALTLASGAQIEPVEAKQTQIEMVLADASRIRLAPGARLVPLASTDSRLDMLLERGSASFAVTPGGPRRWTIAAGLVRVEVVGTEFRVARESDKVEVTVSHGVVLVSGPGVPDGVQRLTAGGKLRVDPVQQPLATIPEPAQDMAPMPAAEIAEAKAALATESSAGEIDAKAPTKRRAAHGAVLPPTPIGSPRAPSQWRTELDAGRYDAAYAAIGKADFPRTTKQAPNAEELLDLADVARLSGHPRDAVIPLTRLLDDFANSPHAAVAAFTLGRLLLDQIYDAKAAAVAFERAINMHPPHALLEDCHARLVQAYARSGSTAEAERAASSYRVLFPNGRHLTDLGRWLKAE